MLCDRNDSEGPLQLMALVNEIIMSENNSDNLRILLISFGNMLYANENNRSIAKDMDIRGTIGEVNLDKNYQDYDMLLEVKNYMISLI